MALGTDCGSFSDDTRSMQRMESKTGIFEERFCIEPCSQAVPCLREHLITEVANGILNPRDLACLGPTVLASGVLGVRVGGEI